VTRYPSPMPDAHLAPPQANPSAQPGTVCCDTNRAQWADEVDAYAADLQVEARRDDQDEHMTDTEREQAIAEAREQMMQHALRMDWPEAHAAQERMRALVAQRSAEQVARMETEQGLV